MVIYKDFIIRCNKGDNDAFYNYNLIIDDNESTALTALCVRNTYYKGELKVSLKLSVDEAFKDMISLVVYHGYEIIDKYTQLGPLLRSLDIRLK